MAAFSPQAGHYHGILSSLSNAVDLHRARKIEERQRLTSRFVDQVMTFDADSSSNAQDRPPDVNRPIDNDGCNVNAGGDRDGIFEVDFEIFESGSYTPFGMSISEGFPWPADDLDIDWQPFAPFLDDL